MEKLLLLNISDLTEEWLLLKWSQKFQFQEKYLMARQFSRKIF